MSNIENTIPNPKTKKTIWTYKNQKRFWAAVFLAPWAIGFATLFLIPMIRSLYYSFFELSTPEGGGLILEFVGFGNYDYAWNDHVTTLSSFRVELINTIIDAGINIPVLLIFSLFIAVLLNMKFKGRAIVRAIFFIPVILNSAAVTSALSGGVPINDLLDAQGIQQVFDLEFYLMQMGMLPELVTFIVGLIDRIYDILSLAGVPILLFLASIQSVPKHLYEAAKIEGATAYEMFWLITLPNVSPHIVTVTVYALVDTFLTSSVSGVISRELENPGLWGQSAALAWIYVMAIIAILLILGILAKAFKIGGSHYEN